jgi:hypothetical protein
MPPADEAPGLSSFGRVVEMVCTENPGTENPTSLSTAMHDIEHPHRNASLIQRGRPCRPVLTRNDKFQIAARSNSTDFLTPSSGGSIMSSCSIDSTSS